MLGRLANRVGGLAKGVAGVALGEAKAALTAVPNDESEVEGLLQRISGSLLPEYRRQAMTQLKDLLVDNPKAQLAFSTMAIPIMVSVLRDDRDDVALLQGALEVMVAATTSAATAHGAPGGPTGGAGHEAHPQHPALTAAEAQAAAVNAELFARQREHVGLLLGLLEDEPVGVPDFYVRYHTVQLLTALLNHCPAKLQEAILATPMSVVRLTELLGERSEVIRNEALLLLAALTRTDGAGSASGGPGAGGGGSEVQKIAAFEGAFDRVAELLREEGGLDGGMVVQDSIELMKNLLRGNMANQRLFREMGHAAMLPKLLSDAVPPPPSAAGAAGGAGAAAGGPGGGGVFAQAAGPIPFLNLGGGGGGGGAAGPFGGDGGDEPSLELHNALAHLAAAGTDALLGPPQLPRQKAANMLGVLDTMRLLCAPAMATADPDRATELSNRAANQSKLLAAGALDALLAAALQYGGVPSAAVRTAALGALGDLVDGLAAARERLAAATVRQPAVSTAAGAEADAPGPPSATAAPPEAVPALRAVLRVALYGSDAGERAAAQNVLAYFCRGNADGQMGLLSTVGPLDPPGAGAAAANGIGGHRYGTAPQGAAQLIATRGSFGQDLVAGLLAGGSSLAAAGAGSAPPTATAAGRGGPGGSGGLLVACRAACVLQCLLQGNAAAKQRLLTVPLEPPTGPGVPPDYLMPRVLRHLTAALRPPCADPSRLVICTLLRLLAVWLHDSPPAVAALLDGAAHLPLLVDLVTGRQGPQAGPGAGTGPAAAAAAASDPAAGGADPIVCGLAACVLGTCILYGRPAAAAQPQAIGPQAPSDLVLDVVMSRIGLSLFFFRLDDIRRSAAFAAAMAATAAAHSAAKPLPRGGGGEAAALASTAEAADGGAASGGGDFQLGHDSAVLVTSVEEGMRQRAMEVFSRPAGHRNTDSLPSTAAEVPGADDSARLGWAVAQLGRLGREVDELRSRNRALAEDLFRMSQGLGTAPAPPPLPGGAAGGASGPPSQCHPQPSHQRKHSFGGPPGASGTGLGGAGVGPGMGGPLGGSSAADVEARVALELRAGRAEQEVAALRQQLEVLSARLGQAEADAAAAREAAAAAHLAATKAEGDLADLSGAYNNLEAHAFATEAQLRTAQTALGAAQAAAAAAEARAHAAEAQARAAGAAHHEPAGLSEDEVARRIQAAVEEAREQAKAEADDSLTDLFVCLGQEEKKVEVLRQELERRGVDAEAILDAIAQQEGEGMGGPDDELR